MDDDKWLQEQFEQSILNIVFCITQKLLETKQIKEQSDPTSGGYRHLHHQKETILLSLQVG